MNSASTSQKTIHWYYTDKPATCPVGTIYTNVLCGQNRGFFALKSLS